MFKLPDLPYEYDALEPYIDKETMKIHHDLHHGTYVKNLNEALAVHKDLLNMEIDELIKNLDKVPQDLRTKVRNNGGGHLNHSLFWKIMLPAQRASSPEWLLKKAIENTFGDFDTFQEKFTNAGLGRFGSGWAWLVVAPSADSGQNLLQILDTQNQDSPLSQGKTPILALDVWEHAYYLKYQNRRADYIKAWWNIVNWREVEENFEKAI